MPLMLQLSLGQLWQAQAQEQEQAQVFEALLAQQMPKMFFSGFVLRLEQPVAAVAAVAAVVAAVAAVVAAAAAVAVVVVAAAAAAAAVAVAAVVVVAAAAAAAGANPRMAQQIIFSARENDARKNMFGHQHRN
jgi:threonine/homoserine/homoserine lactone efflux protein